MILAAAIWSTITVTATIIETADCVTDDYGWIGWTHDVGVLVWIAQVWFGSSVVVQVLVGLVNMAYHSQHSATSTLV